MGVKNFGKKFEVIKGYMTMQIYTGTCGGERLKLIKKHDMGIMISPTTAKNKKVVKEFSKFPCALDNGAFQAWKRGYPFQDELFLRTVEDCYMAGITLDFIVCPDIVCGGEKSLNFSLEWATTKLKTAPHLALVVQDGMTPKMLDEYVLGLFKTLFIGGSVKWKWKTLSKWVKFARDKGKNVHVGQAGSAGKIVRCRELDVDSVDSVSIVRNGKFHYVDPPKTGVF